MKRRRLRRWLAVGWIALVLVGGGLVNAYLALRPAALEAYLRRTLNVVLAAPFQFSSIVLNWEGVAELRGLRIETPRTGDQGPGGVSAAPPANVLPGSAQRAPPVIEIEVVRVVPRLLSLLRGRFEAKRIEILGPSLSLARDAGGAWSVSRLLREEVMAAAAPQPRADSAAPTAQVLAGLPSILIEGGKLHYHEERTGSPPVDERVEEIYALLERTEAGELAVKAQARLRFARKLEARGTARLAGGTPFFELALQGSKLELEPTLQALLPESAAREVRRLALSGFADLTGKVRWSEAEGLVPVEVAVDVLRAELQPPVCPLPVRGLKGRAVLSEKGLSLVGFEGSLGPGKARLSGAVDLPPGWLAGGTVPAPRNFSVDLAVDSVLLDRRFREALPPEAHKILDDYRVDGPVGFSVRVKDCATFPPPIEAIAAEIQLLGVQFTYHLFPYPVEGLRGNVRIEKGRLSIDRPIIGRTGQIDVSVAGRGAELSAYGDLDIAIKVSNVPLDEKFRAALPIEVHGIWDDFQLVGQGDGVIAISREAIPAPRPGPDGKLPRPILPYVTVDAFPAHLRINYRRFPYDLEEIKGRVHIDLKVDRVTFDGLTGRHGEVVVTGSGAVEFGKTVLAERPGGLYKIEIHGADVPIKGDLIAALPTDSRALLEDFDLDGHIDLDVNVQSSDDAGADVAAEVRIKQASATYRKLPLPLQLVGGQIQIIGEDSIVFRNLATAPVARPRLTFGGSLLKKDGRTTLGFDFDVKRLQFDEKLVQALPPPLQSFVDGVKLGGTYLGKVKGTYSFETAHPERYRLIYTGEDVESEDAAVDFGLKIHNMKARGRFVGTREVEQPHRLVGEVDVTSAWFNRIHLTQGQIDFALGAEHPVLSLSRQGQVIPGREYQVPSTILRELTPERVRDAFQVLVHSPDVYGGTVDGFFFVELAGRRRLGADFVGKGFKLASAAEDIFGAKAGGTTGTARGKFSIDGEAGNTQSIRGAGEGVIQDGRLVELPLFLGILSLIFGEGSTRHYFSDVLLKYRIEDGKFIAASDGVEIRSSGIKLLGGGTMDFSGNLDLALEPRVLDIKIPIVEQIFSLVKKGLAVVKISGDLSHPRAQFSTVGGILQIGIGSSGGKEAPPLPTDLRQDGAKDLPPGPK